MSEAAVEYIALFAFVLLLFAAVLGEITWLTRKKWTTPGRAAGYALSTDLFSFGVGIGIALIAFFVTFMMVMGPAGQGSTSPESAYILVITMGIVLPAVFLFFTKRLGLLIFNIRSGRSAWMYSLVTSLVLIAVVLVPPPLLYYLIVSVAEWKR